MKLSNENSVEIIFSKSKEKVFHRTNPLFYILLFLAAGSAVLGGLGLYQPTKDAVEEESDGLKYLAILCNVIINTFVTFKVSNDNINHFIKTYYENEEEESQDRKSKQTSNSLDYCKSLFSIPVSLGSGVVISYISAWSPFLPFWTMFSFQLLNQFNINYYSARPRVSKFIDFLILNKKQKQINAYFNKLLARIDQVNDEVDYLLSHENKDEKVNQLLTNWEAGKWHEFKTTYKMFLHSELPRDSILKNVFFYTFQSINQYSLVIYYNSTFDFFKNLGNGHDSINWLLTSFCLILFHVVTWDFSADALARITDTFNFIVKNRRVNFRYSLNNSRPGKLMLYCLIFSALLGFFYAKNLLDFAAFGYEGVKPNMPFLQMPFLYYLTLLAAVLDSIIYNLMGAVEPCADFSRYNLLLKGDKKMQLLDTLKNFRLICESYSPERGINIAMSVLNVDDDNDDVGLLYSPISTFTMPSGNSSEPIEMDRNYGGLRSHG